MISLLFIQISPKTPPHWVEDQKSLLQMLCQHVEALKVRIVDYVIILWYNSIYRIDVQYLNILPLEHLVYVLYIIFSHEGAICLFI